MSRPEVVVVRYADPLNLNPILYSDLASGEVCNRLNDHLVLTDDAHRFVPGGLLDRWEHDDDGLQWVFHLRPGVHWHDGTKVTASDAQFTLECILDPTVASPRRPEYIISGEPIHFAAEGASTLRATLPRPFGAFLDAMAWRPLLPRHVYASSRGRAIPAPEGLWPVGNGPFQLREWRAGDGLVMDPYPGHPTPAQIRVLWNFVPSQNHAVELLLRSEADYVPGVGPEFLEDIAAAHHLRLRRTSDGNCTMLCLNLRRPIFADLRVRRALAQAVDKARLVTNVLRGYGTPASGPIAPVRRWCSANTPPYPYDPPQAARLLDEAGWLRDADGVRRKAGQPLAFTIVTFAHDALKVAAAAIVAADLRKVGVGADVRAVSVDETFSTYIAPREFDAVLATFHPTYDVEDLYAFYHSAQTHDGWNWTGFQHPQVDQLLDVGRSLGAFADRKPIYDRVQALVVEQVPAVFLYHADVVDGVHRRLLIPEAKMRYGNRYIRMHRWQVSPNAELGDPVGAAASGYSEGRTER